MGGAQCELIACVGAFDREHPAIERRSRVMGSCVPCMGECPDCDPEGCGQGYDGTPRDVFPRARLLAWRAADDSQIVCSRRWSRRGTRIRTVWTPPSFLRGARGAGGECGVKVAARVELQLAEDAREVALDRTCGDEEGLRDLPHGQATTRVFRDAPLARGQGAEPPDDQASRTVPGRP